jgi:hypothetical protein
MIPFKEIKTIFSLLILQKNLKKITFEKTNDTIKKIIDKSILKIISLEEPFSKNNDNKNPKTPIDKKLQHHYRDLVFSQQYILYVLEKDFNNAFNLAFSIQNQTTNNDDKVKYIELASNALLQIKTNYYKRNKIKEYQDLYSEKENDIITKNNAINYFSQSTGKKEFYNETNITIASLYILDNQKEKSKEYIEQQINKFGINKILYVETDRERDYWWFNNTDLSIRDTIIKTISIMAQPILRNTLPH